MIWQEPYIQFSREDTEIDFGGIGKEYAVDRVADLLQTEGIKSGFVNLGGDLRAWGKPLGRDQWNFGIRQRCTFCERIFVPNLIMRPNQHHSIKKKQIHLGREGEYRRLKISVF